MTVIEMRVLRDAVQTAKNENLSKRQVIDDLYSLFNFNRFKYTIPQIESTVNIYW